MYDTILPLIIGTELKSETYNKRILNSYKEKTYKQ